MKKTPQLAPSFFGLDPSVEQVHVLLIVENQESQLLTQKLLESKGWTVAIRQSFQQALRYVVENNPQYVLFSFNHPDPQVKESPKVIERNFNVQCVAFCERKTKNASKILMQSGLKHMLFPPVTGEAIFDKVSRMVRDQNKDKIKKDRSYAAVSPDKAQPLFEVEDPKQQGRAKISLFEDVGQRISPAKMLIGTVSQSVASQAPSNPILDSPVRSSEAKGAKPLSNSPGSWFQEIVEPSFSSTSQSFNEKNGGDKFEKTEGWNYSVLPVKGDKFIGFLLLRSPFKNENLQAVLNQMATEMRRLSSNLGHKILVGEAVPVGISEKEISQIAIDNAWMKKDNLLAEPVSLFAIESQVIEPRVNPSQDNTIYTINWQDIEASSVLTFNLYIYLPKNNKYYLFARKGRPIASKRMKRLENMEHQLFIEQNEILDFKGYFIRNILNGRFTIIV